MGFDFFAQSVDTIFNEYIERYNSERTSGHRKINTHKSAPFNGGHYQVTRNGGFEVSSSEDKINYSAGFSAKSADGKTIDGAFNIAITVEQPATAQKNGERRYPQMKLTLGEDTTGLAKHVFTFEDGHYFDQPSATRLLSGFIRSINEYVKEEAGSSYMTLDSNSKNFVLLLNCGEGDVRIAHSKPVASDKTDFGVSNNALNFILPYSYQLRFNTLVERAFAITASMIKIADDYDLRQARGLFRLTKDDAILSALPKKEDHTIPSFKTIKSPQLGSKDGKPIDRLRFTSGMFVEFQDYTNKTLNDLAIAPMDVNVELNANLIDNEDGSQTFNAEFAKIKFKFRKCEFVFNPKLSDDKAEDQDKKAAQQKKDDDDGDFDDDAEDDEEDEDAGLFGQMLGIDDGKRRIKKSNFQMLGCGAKGMLPSKIKENQERVNQLSKQVVDFITG